MTQSSFAMLKMRLSNGIFKQLAVDGAFGSYSEASGGRLASLAYTPPQLATLAPGVEY